MLSTASAAWCQRIVKKLGLEHTMRSPERPTKKKFDHDSAFFLFFAFPSLLPIFVLCEMPTMCEMSTQPIILLMPKPARPTGWGINLPDTKDNLFERLIRDPTAPHRPARERQCTEMLCSVLLNAPTTRQLVLQWLAVMVGVHSKILSELDWQFDTELAIGSKRDDLRIEAFTHSEISRQVVLWTVEVKVAASIHLSSEQGFDDDLEPLPMVDEEDAILVSQIQNYDRWLSRMRADQRAGFVLAITNQSTNLPANLKMSWHCFTWTELALIVEQGILNETIPDSELMLARHLCGFIRDHLWKEENMSSAQFDFDDLALMRAFKEIGHDCFSKVKELAAGCLPVLESALKGYYETIAHQKALNGPSNRSAAYVKFLEEVKGGSLSPALYAGIEGGEARVWIESSPPSPAKTVLSKHVKRVIPSLRERNIAWQDVDSDSSWIDVLLTKPLEWILTCEDQQEALNEFVTSAVFDLKEVGLIDAICQELRQRN